MGNNRAGYYAKYYSVLFDPCEDYSYVAPWMDLLKRLDELYDRRDELIDQGGGYRNIASYQPGNDPQRRLADEEVYFALPEDLNWVDEIDLAITLAKKDLIEDWGLNVDLIVEPLVDQIQGQMVLPIAG